MKTTKSVYDDTFFSEEYIEKTSQSAHEIAKELWEIIQPKSIVDVGCGIGLFLEAFSRRGATDVWGIDGEWVDLDKLRIPKEHFSSQDLCLPVQSSRQFDLAICLEVAEHLPDTAASTLVKSLVNLAPLVLFSAAIPMQGGMEHVNEQWPEYWSSLFVGHDYVPVDCVRRRVWSNENVLWWYAQNTILFVKKDCFQRLPQLRIEFEKAMGMPLSLVHPEAFLNYRKPVKQIISKKISFHNVLGIGKRWFLQKLA